MAQGNQQPKFERNPCNFSEINIDATERRTNFGFHKLCWHSQTKEKTVKMYFTDTPHPHPPAPTHPLLLAKSCNMPVSNVHPQKVSLPFVAPICRDVLHWFRYDTSGQSCCRQNANVMQYTLRTHVTLHEKFIMSEYLHCIPFCISILPNALLLNFVFVQ